MGVFMGSTKIPAKQTAGRMQEILADAGAKAVAIDYDDDKEACAIAFRIIREGEPLQFSLPVRWRGCLKLLEKERSRLRVRVDETQAKRVAWRQVLRWTEAQLAMIETESVDIVEVFLPYLLVDGRGTTFYEKAIADKTIPPLLALPAPK